MGEMDSFDKNIFEDSLKEAYDSSISANNILSITSSTRESIPEDYELLSEVEEILVNSEQTSENIINVERSLNEMYIEAMQYVVNKFQNIAGITDITFGDGFISMNINGQPGNLYLPENFDANKLYALVTYLPGSAGIGDLMPFEEFLNSGFAKENSDAFIWTPTKNFWQKNEEEEYYTFNSINKINDALNLDRERQILFGFSMGGDTAMEMCAAHPNFFSSCVTYGSSCPNINGSNSFNSQYEDTKEALAKSGTNFYVFNGKNDEINNEDAANMRDYVNGKEDATSIVTTYTINGIPKVDGETVDHSAKYSNLMFNSNLWNSVMKVKNNDVIILYDNLKFNTTEIDYKIIEKSLEELALNEENSNNDNI